jgi:hypothetical protein
MSVANDTTVGPRASLRLRNAKATRKPAIKSAAMSRAGIPEIPVHFADSLQIEYAIVAQVRYAARFMTRPSREEITRRSGIVPHL